MYLWIDLWDKRCWIAITVENIVVPKEIVPRTKLIKTLQKYTSEYNIEAIIVWLPYDLYWKQTKQLEKTIEFIEKLKIIFPLIKIDSIDERYTTFEAENILDALWDKSPKKDDISAALILESYLKQNFNK